MNQWLTLLLWLTAMLSASAQGPRMTVAGTATILEIEEASVNIRLTGGVASTEMELVFRNPVDRMVEGEFALALPPGATVSSYALEVNGALREAVAVEKERARNAYESIKRQMIDPGIVEREAGNVYRTRIFPIPAKGTKRLRIGYVESLPQAADRFLYRVPLKFEGELAKFRCEIEGAKKGELKLAGIDGLTFTSGDADGRRICEAKSVRLEGTLEWSQPLPKEPELAVEWGNEPVFLLADTFPAMPEEQRPPARSAVLCWDASESMADVDREPVFRLLDAWFREQGEVRVTVKLLRDQAENAGVHEVRRGDWSALRKILEAVDHEGATSLAGIAASDKDADVMIYCGDGAATLGSGKTGMIECPLFVLHGGSGPLENSLREAVRRTGGAEVNVDREEIAAAMRKLAFFPYRVIGISGDSVKDSQVEDGPQAPGNAVRVSGALHKPWGGTIEIAYGVGTEVKVRRTVAMPGRASDGGLLRRLWAQRRLLELERQPLRDAGEITAHCRKHALVSDETSLIVLERFEDHLRYEIPPPEPDLLARYQRELARTRGDGLLAAWQARVAWWERPFPGREHVLLPRLKQIAIWKRSVEKVFKPEELDAAAFAKVTGWHDRVLALIERKRKLPDAKAYDAWMAEIKALDDEGPKLAGTTVAPPPAGRPLVVSVRGLVKEPAQVRAEGRLTLRQAIAKAGGPLLGGSDHVALYRNAGKTVYNMASKRFEDIELRPGDMVVLEERWRYMADDPFSGGGGTSPEESPAVVEQQDVWIGDDPAAGDGEGGDPFAGFGGGHETRAKAGAIRLIDPADAGMPDLADFERELAAGADVSAAYLELKGGKLRPTRFHVEVARRLFAKGHDGLAARVLSTLVERGDGSGAARRAFAFWLMEFGKSPEADAVLADISSDKGGCPAAFARAELTRNPVEAATRLESGIDRSRTDELRVIALTELNRLKPSPHPAGKAFAKNLAADLRITVMSQFSDAAPDVEIIEATGHPLRRWSDSPTGGHLTVTEGITEYMVRRAVPGTYAVRISCKADTTFRIALHTGWGRPDQKTVRTTRLVEAGERDTVAELEFQFAAAAE